MVAGLTPAALDGDSLATAIGRQADRLQAETGIAVTVVADPDLPSLGPDGVSVQANDLPETQLTPDTDYAALAKACGGTGQTVRTPQDMGEAIQWALGEADQGRCAVLDVRLPQP